MFTAARARYLTFTSRYSLCINFATEAFHHSRNITTKDHSLSVLWTTNFEKTVFDSHPEVFEEIAGEILLCRTVDAFLYYLADIFRWALWRRPAISKLLEEAKQYSETNEIALEDAIELQTQLYVEAILFKGFKYILKSIEQTFGIALPVDQTPKEKIDHIIAIRNIIVHNHSRKNSRYCKRVGEPIAHIGQSVKITIAEAASAAILLGNFVTLLDEKLCQELLEFRKID